MGTVEFMQPELAQGTVDSHSYESGKENGAMHLQGNEVIEPIRFGSYGTVESTTKGEVQNLELDFAKDVVDEWPAPMQTHSFYFVKYRSYEDPKLKGKREKVDGEIEKLSQAKAGIIKKIIAKKSDRAEVIAQSQALSSENKTFKAIMDENKKTAVEPRAIGSAHRDKGGVLCSSEKDLNDLIKSLEYRIEHESISLSEERQILREIKLLEGTREKVIANDAKKRTMIQFPSGEKEAVHVQRTGGELDRIRKEQQVVKSKLKRLSEEFDKIGAEINALESELEAIKKKIEKAHETRKELKKQHQEGNACFYQYLSFSDKARELAKQKNIEALEEIRASEVEKFMFLWNSNKAFTDDYLKRIPALLGNQQLRNPNAKVLEMITGTNVKIPKDENSNGALPAEKAEVEVKKKSQKEAKKIMADSGSSLRTSGSEEAEKVSGLEEIKEVTQSKPVEVDEAKLKKMRREEGIAKAKLAMERKKKLAEKAAARAAVKAQKEAEKRHKDQEKKAKKPAAMAPSSEPEAQPTEAADAEAAESEKAEENVGVVAPSPNREVKRVNRIQYRNRPRGPGPIPKVVAKRKKSDHRWIWLAFAALAITVLLAFWFYHRF